jgi:hypothetical protein
MRLPPRSPLKKPPACQMTKERPAPGNIGRTAVFS